MGGGGGHPVCCLSETTRVCACVCVNGCFFSGLVSNLCFEYCPRSDLLFLSCFVFVWSDNRGETKMEMRGEERGLWKSYLWFSVRTRPVRLLARASATELALFHTGAILSPLGRHSPATATWEHLGGDKCLCGVCVEALVCA